MTITSGFSLEIAWKDPAGRSVEQSSLLRSGLGVGTLRTRSSKALRLLLVALTGSSAILDGGTGISSLRAGVASGPRVEGGNF